MVLPLLIPTAASFIRIIRRGIVINKKLILPIFRKIHPDLFSQHIQEVRNRNLFAIQSLNEFWESVHHIKDALEKRPQNLSIKSPLKTSYDFCCYLLQGEQTNEKTVNLEVNPPKKISFFLRPAPMLCSKQVLQAHHVKDAIQTLEIDFGQYFTMIGVDNPWSDADLSDPYKSKSKKKIDEESPVQGVSLQQIDQDIFERSVKRDHRRSAFSAFGKRNPSEESLHVGEVDGYIHRQHVFVRKLKSTEEFLAIQRLRTFLIHYGEVINFNNANWQKVFFLLSGSDDSISGNNKDTNSTSKNGLGGGLGSHKPVYHCEIKGEFFILEIPHNFKVKVLLQFINNSLPLSRYVSN